MNRNLIYGRLRDLGFKPKVCIDGGACRGEWSSEIREIFPETYIMGVDANDWNGNGGFPNTNVGEVEVLSNKEGEEVIFYKKIEGHCTGDSLFKENTTHYSDELLIKEKRTTTTLKSLCEKHNIKKIDLLKLDTQGSEIIIMEGMGDMLNSVDYIELECSIIEWNINGCKIGDVIEFLSPQFEIYEIVEFHRLNNVELIQVDVVFKNKNLI